MVRLLGQFRDFWRPAVPADRDVLGLLDRHPPVGALIAVSRRPYRVTQVRDVPPGDWTDRARQAWADAGMPDPWPLAPFELHVDQLPTGRRAGMTVVQPWHEQLLLLPEHYAVCACCGELAPCPEITAGRTAAHVMERFERLSRILPGCCWGCSEPITSRQASVVFDGPNLWLPTAPPDPVFHLRRGCRSSAARYEDDWVAASSHRPRSLLTLACAGSVVVHHDGSAECFGAVDSDCPDVRAAHRSYSACYAQSHGCPRDCARDGHPGCYPGRRRR